MNPFRYLERFKAGRNQAVTRRECDAPIIEAAPVKSLLGILGSLSPVNEDFPPFDDPPPGPVEVCGLAAWTPKSVRASRRLLDEEWP